MARSVWKGPFVDLHLLKKAEVAQDLSLIHISEPTRPY